MFLLLDIPLKIVAKGCFWTEIIQDDPRYKTPTFFYHKVLTGL